MFIGGHLERLKSAKEDNSPPRTGTANILCHNFPEYFPYVYI